MEIQTEQTRNDTLHLIEYAGVTVIGPYRQSKQENTLHLNEYAEVTEIQAEQTRNNMYI